MHLNECNTELTTSCDIPTKSTGTLPISCAPFVFITVFPINLTYAHISVFYSLATTNCPTTQIQTFQCFSAQLSIFHFLPLLTWSVNIIRQYFFYPFSLHCQQVIWWVQAQHVLSLSECVKENFYLRNIFMPVCFLENNNHKESTHESN